MTTHKEAIELFSSWVNGDISREVNIKGHISGVRVTLYERNHHVSFATGDFLYCTDSILSNMNRGQKQMLINEVTAAKERVKRVEAELGQAKRDLSIANNRLSLAEENS